MDLSNLAKLLPLDLTTEILGLMVKKDFKKGHILHKEGTVCAFIYLIEKGIARTFYYKEGKNISVHFAIEGELTTAIDSLISKKYSRYGIELLEDSEIQVIPYQKLQELLLNYPHYEQYIREILIDSYIQLAERVEEFLFFSAKERYHNLIIDKPFLLQRVSLGHVASYLGITQETLSRIRKRI